MEQVYVANWSVHAYRMCLLSLSSAPDLAGYTFDCFLFVSLLALAFNTRMCRVSLRPRGQQTKHVDGCVQAPISLLPTVVDAYTLRRKLRNVHQVRFPSPDFVASDCCRRIHPQAKVAKCASIAILIIFEYSLGARFAALTPDCVQVFQSAYQIAT